MISDVGRAGIVSYGAAVRCTVSVLPLTSELLGQSHLIEGGCDGGEGPSAAIG